MAVAGDVVLGLVVDLLAVAVAIVVAAFPVVLV